MSQDSDDEWLAETRAKVDKWLRKNGKRPLTDLAWGYLEPEVHNGLPVDRLGEIVLRSRERAAQARTGEASTPEALTARARALEAWAVAHAVQDVGVKRFRDQHLRPLRRDLSSGPVEYVDPGRVTSWLVKRCPDLKGVTTGTFRGSPVGTFAPMAPPAILTWLELGTDEVWTPTEVPVRDRGPALELACLADRLHHMYAWDRAQAATWVLAGDDALVPEVLPVSAWGYSRQAWWTASTGQTPAGADFTTAYGRVSVELDPELTPEEVADWWREVRRTLQDDGRKARRPDPKACALAVDALHHQVGRGEWDAAVQQWNAEHPEWAFHGAQAGASFRRGRAEALRRLLSPM